ncbi:MAG: hypothetical protein AAF495_12465 [Pseudomonadota bacterium]
MATIICLLSSVVWMAGAAQAADVLKQFELNDPAELGLTIESDTTSDGRTVTKVTTAWPTVVNLTEVQSPNVEDATLVYSAQVRSQDLEGQAYLEMWCHFADGGSYFSRGFDDVLTGTTEWQTLSTKFLLEAGQRPDRITLNIVINGRGTLWASNATLSVEK